MPYFRLRASEEKWEYHSACEDFVMPFKDNGRAVLVGGSTAGSSGQPYVLDLGHDMIFMHAGACGFLRDPDNSSLKSTST